MSKREMCENWRMEPSGFSSCGIACFRGATRCPKNINFRCEIVPRKAKPKMVRVKAWAKRGYMAGPGEIVAQSFDCPTRLIRVPCIITMTEKDYNRVWPKKVLEAEAKYLKGRK